MNNIKKKSEEPIVERLFMWLFGNNTEEAVYYTIYEPCGLYKNKDGSFSVSVIKKSYGYWGNLIKSDIEKKRYNNL